jgi:hypothetical protein
MWIELDDDVMVAGTPRKSGERFDLYESEASLLIDARKCHQVDGPIEAEPLVCPAPKTRKPISTTKEN